MARSWHRFYYGLTSREGCRGFHHDNSGSCHQDGALDPVLENHHSRRGCKIILVAGGQASWNSSSYPYGPGCSIRRQMVARDLDIAGYEAKIWNCVSSSKPGIGREDERHCIIDASLFDERCPKSNQMARIFTHRGDGNKLSP